VLPFSCLPCSSLHFSHRKWSMRLGTWKILDLHNDPFHMSFSKCWQLCNWYVESSWSINNLFVHILQIFSFKGNVYHNSSSRCLCFYLCLLFYYNFCFGSMFQKSSLCWMYFTCIDDVAFHFNGLKSNWFYVVNVIPCKMPLVKFSSSQRTWISIHILFFFLSRNVNVISSIRLYSCHCADTDVKCIIKKQVLLFIMKIVHKLLY